MSKAVNGYHFTLETMGTLDGPGISFVLQDCPLRCPYCHNPEGWEMGCGVAITPKDVLE